MFQLLNPIWLFALGGILIPLIIHLWNVKKGKTLKIGSTILLGESSRQNARSLQFQDIPLLLLRILILTILAFLLAGPVWMSMQKPGGQKGWVLVEKPLLKTAYSGNKIYIDSLVKSGYSLHYFEPGFPEFKLQDALADTSRAYSPNTYWSLVKTLDQQIRPSFPVVLFTGNQQKRFIGSRPTVSFKLTWKLLPQDSTAAWISRAYLTSGDSIRVAKKTSKSSGTQSSWQTIPLSYQDDFIKSSISNGRLWLSLKNENSGNLFTDTQKITVDTSAIQLAVYTDKFRNDAAYLEAALKSIRDYTQRRIKITRISEDADFQKFDWIFWLSEKAVPVQKSQNKNQQRNIFSYAPGKVIRETAFFAGGLSNTNGTEQTEWHQRISAKAKAPNELILWEDSYGNPILSFSESANTGLFRFYSRFNPSFTNLVWQNRFLELLLELLSYRDKSNVQNNNESLFEQGTIDEKEARVNYIPGNKTGIKSTRNENDLRNYFWLLAAMLFGLERWISHTKLKRNNV